MSSGENNTVVLITEHSGAMTGLRACVNEQDVRRRRPNADIDVARVTSHDEIRAEQSSADERAHAGRLARAARRWRVGERTQPGRACESNAAQGAQFAQVRESGPAAGERRF